MTQLATTINRHDTDEHTGVTTYAPLARNVKAGDRVGIIGIGGLGHMALQYAR